MLKQSYCYHPKVDNFPITVCLYLTKCFISLMQQPAIDVHLFITDLRFIPFIATLNVMIHSQGKFLPVITCVKAAINSYSPSPASFFLELN